MDDYIAKPLRRKDLLAMVDKWVRPVRTMASKGLVAPEDAPINFERAVEEFEGDEEFLMEVLEGFVNNVRAQIGRIRQAILDSEPEVVRREAHSIKGGAANLTADGLSTTALEMERIGKSGDLKGGLEALGKLEEAFYCLEAYARAR